MRKLFIGLLITSSLLLISIVCNVIFGVAWKEQTAETNTLASENERLKAKLRASKENNESLKEIGEHFVNTMFTYDNKTAPGLKDKLLKQTEGKAKDKLLEKPKTGETSEIEVTEAKYYSEVDIKESSFSRINEEEAVVTIHFDQVLTVSGTDSKSEYTMKVYLERTAKEWKVIDFDMQQLF